MKNVLGAVSRKEFREWLARHAAKETECWAEVRRGRPDGEPFLWYVDAVEEAYRQSCRSMNDEAVLSLMLDRIVFP